jgi:hypothetical protein
MLENSLWKRYHDTKTIREALSALYACDASQIGADESELYAIIKRFLTKKELKLFIMKEAGISDEGIREEIGLTEDELPQSLKKIYHKLRNKVRPAIKEAGE